MQLKFDAALSLRVADPVKAVTMLCRGSFDMGTLLKTIHVSALESRCVVHSRECMRVNLSG